MDINRCRFVPFPASPIKTLAFSHPQPSAKRQARLAIGRANGDIEIWSPLNGNWIPETTIHGGRDREIDTLVWATDEREQMLDEEDYPSEPRLFSTGYTSTVTEWDLEKGRAKAHASGEHGDIWCLAVQPPNDPNDGIASSSQPQRLVAGTIDGSIALYSIGDGTLDFQRMLVKTSKKNIKMVSIAFRSRQEVVVGCSDSSIRVYDMRRGQQLGLMTLGKDLIGGSKNIIVWSVKCLKNGDIVSGDSTGQICIWDGNTYSQAQRIQGHESDVLSLATAADGQTIISGGMDKRTVFYRPTKNFPPRWRQIFSRKYHDHDVKTMASFEGLGMSVVVTGGPDATPVVIPLRQAGVENHRTLSHLPQSVPLQSAPQARVMISWWDREIHIWKLRQSMQEHLDSDDAEQSIKNNRSRLGQMLIKGEANITSCSISRDGSIMFVSTIMAIKAFHLTIPNLDLKEKLEPLKVKLPSIIESAGATMLQISPDSRWLCWVKDGHQVHIAEIIREDRGFSIKPGPTDLIRLREQHNNLRRSGLGAYGRRVTHIAFSPDSRILATADLAGHIDTWLLRDDGVQNETASAEDDAASSSHSSLSSFDEYGTGDGSGPRAWILNPKASLLPKLSHAPVVLSFSDDALGPILRDEGKEGPDDYVLLAVTSASRIYTFNPLEGRLTHWSNRNAAWKLPEKIKATRDPIKGVVWSGSRAWMYTASSLFMIDLSQDFLEPEFGSSKKSRKRKRGADSGAGSKTEKGPLAPQQVRMSLAGEGKTGEWVDVEMEEAEPQAQGIADEDEDDDAEEVGGEELEKLRKREQREGDAPGAEEQLRKWWYTFKYRPILGVLPMENGKGQTNGSKAIEVALVERPK